MLEVTSLVRIQYKIVHDFFISAFSFYLVKELLIVKIRSKYSKLKVL
jgi:hypothetical protein